MTIITLTDIHAHKKAIESIGRQLQSVDLVLLGGDITHFGHKKEMAEMLGLVRGFNPTSLPLILLSHQPPFGILNDEVSPGYHVGSKTIRGFIEKHQPLICFTGHIHEGIGIDHIGSTTVVNPGPAGKGGFVFTEISAGKIKKLEVTQPFH